MDVAIEFAKQTNYTLTALWLERSGHTTRLACATKNLELLKTAHHLMAICPETYKQRTRISSGTHTCISTASNLTSKLRKHHMKIPIMLTDAKKAAVEALDACPDETIRRFVNRTWHFISAYRQGLKGKAAAWAVKKQKGHRSCSQRSMMYLEAVLR